EYEADYLALGHHADDQLETMLMNLVRSGNPKSLSGIPLKRPFSCGQIIRPLLCVTKDEIESYCQTKDITPRLDASNEDTIYTRNAIRKNITPYIKKLNPNVHSSLQHLSEALQAYVAYLMDIAQEMVDRIVTFTRERREASFEMESYNTFPRDIQRRAVHLILNHLYPEIPKNQSSIHEENFFELVKSN